LLPDWRDRGGNEIRVRVTHPGNRWTWLSFVRVIRSSQNLTGLPNGATAFQNRHEF